MMNHRASRAKCHAGGGPLERRVRPLCLRAKDYSCTQDNWYAGPVLS